MAGLLSFGSQAFKGFLKLFDDVLGSSTATVSSLRTSLGNIHSIAKASKFDRAASDALSTKIDEIATKLAREGSEVSAGLSKTLQGIKTTIRSRVDDAAAPAGGQAAREGGIAGVKGDPIKADALIGAGVKREVADATVRLGAVRNSTGTSVKFPNGQKVMVSDLSKGKFSAGALEGLSKIPPNAGLWARTKSIVQGWGMPLVFIGLMLPGIIWGALDRRSSSAGQSSSASASTPPECEATTITGVCGIDELIGKLFPNMSPEQSLMLLAALFLIPSCLCCFMCCCMVMLMMSSSSSSNASSSY